MTNDEKLDLILEILNIPFPTGVAHSPATLAGVTAR